MKFVTGTFFLAVAASLVDAKPFGIHHTSKPLPTLHRRNTSTTISLEDACQKWKLDDVNMDIAAQLWTDLVIGEYLDTTLRIFGTGGWLNNMDRDTRQDGVSYLDCVEIGPNCPPPQSCEEFYDKGAYQVYWIEVAATQLYGGLNTLHETFQDDSFVDSLNISGIKSDFHQSDPQISAISLAQAGFVVASGAAGFLPETAGSAAGAGFAMIIGFLGMMSTLSAADTIDPTADMETAMSTYYDHYQDAINNVLATVLGGQGDVSALSGAVLDTNYQNPITQYFGDGRFLLVNVGDMFDQIADTARTQQKQSMIIAMLRDLKYFVLIDGSITSQDDCTNTGFQSAWWDGTQCFYLCKQPDANIPVALKSWQTDDVWAPMLTYGFTPDVFYPAALQCAQDNPNGDGTLSDDLNSIPTNGDLPGCLYNLGVVVGQWKGPVTVHDCIVDITLNTQDDQS